MTKKSQDINYISKDLFPKSYRTTMIDDMYKQLQQENKQLKENNLNKYLPNIVKLISSGEIPKDVYNKYLGNVPCGFMSEKELLEWFLENSDK